jgi:LytS/YehU family sensor histidine kinase
VLEGLNAELKDQKERIEEINRLLRLKVLRAQINPHFIYNCLHAIGNLVRKGDAAGATGYLDGFARLLRMVLDQSVRDRVPLSQEIDFLRQYLKLEALRFEDGLNYQVEADPALLEEDDAVPALVVQPFVENAIWHGLATKEGDKRVRIRFAQRDGRIICTVEDNGIGRDAAPHRDHADGSPSMGLQLTNERLQLLTFRMQEAGSVRFTDLKERGVASGTRVEVVLG